MNSGKVAMVTGAGTGVGRSVALALLADGWSTVLVGRRIGLLDETLSLAPAGAAKGFACACDVGQEDAVDGLFADVARRFGRLDLLFNNAGMTLPGRLIDELSVTDWTRVMNVSVTGSFLCARAAFRQMRNQEPRGGRIINNGSVSAYSPRPGSAAYTTSKHAITGLTKTLALDGRPFDIACGQIDIGNAATEMAAPMASGVIQPDGTVRPEAVMDVEHIARSVLLMANMPLDTNVLFMNVMATKMPFVGRG